jgi:hypothetical protein
MSFLSNIFGNKSGAAVKPDELVGNWLKELEEAKKREKGFRKDGEKCVKVYEGTSDADQTVTYNILYANTETLGPALYNNTPRPVVKRRHADENPAATWGATVLVRTLVGLLDASQSKYTSFDELQRTALLQALVPGRGISRFRYKPIIEGTGDDEKLVYETVCGETVDWDRLLIGFASTWTEVPWIAIEHFYTRAELKRHFGNAVGEQIALTAGAQNSDGEKKNDLPRDSEGGAFARVFEIFDRENGRILWISDGFPKPIRIDEDESKLEGFFPIPKPLQFVSKIGSMVPIPVYMTYEHQANELDLVTRRITNLTRMLKARGFYDGTLRGIDTLVNSPDGTLLPAENVAAMQQGQSVEKAVWMWPLETIIATLQQLYQNREGIKQVIYEITGIADIVRGSSKASETLGAQKMKEAWGTMRLKRGQKETQRYAKDCLRIMAELAVNHFHIETFERMTGVKLPRREQLPLLQQELTMLKDQQIQDGMMAQAQGMQPSPPNPKIAELGKFTQLPTWEDVLDFLRNDLFRNYIIEIETNSTIDAEATEDREQVAELLNGMSQLFSGMVPMLEKGFMSFPVAKGIMLKVAQKFDFGQEVEDELKMMQAPPPKADPAEEKVRAEMERDAQRFQMEREDKEAERALTKEKQQMELAEAREKHRLEMEKMAREQAMAQAEHRRKLQEMALQAMLPPPAPPAGKPNGKGNRNANV